MTRTNFPRYGVAVLSLCALFLFFCSNLDQSTNLGSGIINSVDSGKTEINGHFHGMLLDSSYYQGHLSVPFRGDTGFGYHTVTSKIYIGRANNERSAGYVEIVLRRDSLASTRSFIGGDTLKSVKMFFTHDSISPVIALQFDLYEVDKKNKPLDTVPGQKLGTIAFNENGVSSTIDTVEVSDTAAGSFTQVMCDSIFRACSTATTDTLQRNDTIRFGFINQSAGFDSLNASCSLVLYARRPGTDTTLRTKVI